VILIRIWGVCEARTPSVPYLERNNSRYQPSRFYEDGAICWPGRPETSRLSEVWPSTLLLESQLPWGHPS
jgi:hypothetical protein